MGLRRMMVLFLFLKILYGNRILTGSWDMGLMLDIALTDGVHTISFKVQDADGTVVGCRGRNARRWY